jgi:hypothetical protein
MNSKVYEEYNYWLGPNEDSNWNEYITEQIAHGVLGKFNAMDWQQLNESILLNRNTGKKEALLPSENCDRPKR